MDKEAPVPVVQVDYHFFNDDGSEAETAEASLSTTLGVVDCDTGTPLQLSLPRKSGSDDYCVSSLVGFMKRLGHTTVRLRSDGEPTVMALCNAVASKRLKQEGQKTIV